MCKASQTSLAGTLVAIAQPTTLRENRSITTARYSHPAAVRMYVMSGPEFKAKVGLEAVRGVKTINEIAQECGVHPVLVGQWKKEILEQAGTLFEGKRGPKPKETHEREDRLYGEIGRLKMELAWLKKKSGL